MDDSGMDKFAGRIAEFLNWGNLYGARAFLGMMITKCEKDGNLEGGDPGGWTEMYDREVQEGIIPNVLERPLLSKPNTSS